MGKTARLKYLAGQSGECLIVRSLPGLDRVREPA
jgi:hypothetical protein